MATLDSNGQCVGCIEKFQLHTVYEPLIVNANWWARLVQFVIVLKLMLHIVAFLEDLAGDSLELSSVLADASFAIL